MRSEVALIVCLIFILVISLGTICECSHEENGKPNNVQANEDKQIEIPYHFLANQRNHQHDVEIAFGKVKIIEADQETNKKKVTFNDIKSLWTVVPPKEEKNIRVTRQINQQHQPLYPQLPSSQYPGYNTGNSNSYYPTQPNQNTFGHSSYPNSYPSYNPNNINNSQFNPTYPNPPQNGQYPSYNGTGHQPYNPTTQKYPYGVTQTSRYPSYNFTNTQKPNYGQQPPYGMSPSYTQTPPYNQYPRNNYTNPSYPSYTPTQRPASNTFPTGHYPTSNSYGPNPPFNPTGQRPPFGQPTAQYPGYNPSQQKPGNWQNSQYNTSSNPNLPNTYPYNPNYSSQYPAGQVPSQYPGYNHNQPSYPGHAVGTLPSNYTNPQHRF